MNGKSAIMLMLAVVCGLGAMYGTSQLLSKQNKNRPLELQDVLVAARNLKAEEVLKPDMVRTVKRPKESVPSGAFATVKDVVDRSLQMPILADEPLLDAKLAPRGTPAGLVSRIPAGMRAFAIEVNEQTGVSGFILPGHRVDIIQTKGTPGSPGGAEAEVLLQNVQVLASGQVFTRPEDKSILSRTVTLAVTPEQVEILVASRSRGALSLALRGVNDNDVVERPRPQPAPAPVPDLAALKPPPPPPPAPAPLPPPARRRLVIVHGLSGVESYNLGAAPSRNLSAAEPGANGTP